MFSRFEDENLEISTVDCLWMHFGPLKEKEKEKNTLRCSGGHVLWLHINLFSVSSLSLRRKHSFPILDCQKKIISSHMKILFLFRLWSVLSRLWSKLQGKKNSGVNQPTWCQIPHEPLQCFCPGLFRGKAECLSLLLCVPVLWHNSI